MNQLLLFALFTLPENHADGALDSTSIVEAGSSEIRGRLETLERGGTP